MSDLLPHTDRELVDMLQNLGVRLAAVVATFNLTAADATAVTTDATNLRTLVLDQADKENAAKSATAAKITSRTTVVKRTRALIRRLKAHANYTPAMVAARHSAMTAMRTNPKRPGTGRYLGGGTIRPDGFIC